MRLVEKAGSIRYDDRHTGSRNGGDGFASRDVGTACIARFHARARATRRRTLLGDRGAAGAGIGVGVGGLLGTGASGRATARRDATIDVVVGDGYLALTDTGDYATETDAGAPAPSLTGDRGTENGGGVPINSTYS